MALDVAGGSVLGRVAVCDGRRDGQSMQCMQCLMHTMQSEGTGDAHARSL